MLIPGHLTGEPRCRAALAALGLAWPFLRPGVPMPTVAAAATAIGVAPELIAKTVVFVDPAGAIVVAIASGLDRIDRRRLAEIVGTPGLRLADPDTVLASTGYPAGGVGPVGHRLPGRTVIDLGVSGLPMVYAGGGEHDLLLRVEVPQLIATTTATIASIPARPPPSAGPSL